MPPIRSSAQQRPSRVRQADVAERAGVSQATVSLVLSDTLRDATRVAGPTRERVLQVAQELGYSVDPVARNLVGGRNQLIGVFTFESVFPVESRDFYQDLLVGIQDAAEAVDYDLLLFTSASSPRRRGLYSSGMNRMALSDGGILLGRHGNRDEVRRLCHERFPFVYVGRRDIDQLEHGLWYVTADYRSATRTVVDHLTGLGHRRIAYLGFARPDEPDLDRATGWHDTVATLEDGVELRPDVVTPELLLGLRRDRGTTAVVVENAESADGVMTAAATAGLTVPGDLSIAVLGDLPVRSLDHPRWTGFTTPRREMGRAAVDLLLERLGATPDTPPRSHYVSCGFEPGTSCATPPPEQTRTTR